MDTYQAIYDAVRSKIGGFDGQRLCEEISHRFDISHAVEMIRNEFMSITYDMGRPSMLLKPKLAIDGNQWCALYGEDLQCGVAGFGDSPALAYDDFDKSWNKTLAIKGEEAHRE